MEAKIKSLLKQKNAVLLAHNYQPPEIQYLADMCGDSLELSIKASQTDADVIVFCGVHFMAETASILSPQKTVLLPQLQAGCPMADMITADALKARKLELPGVPVVTYVNSPAAVKALSTICCTSANAVNVVNSIGGNEVLMTPDRNLAQYTAEKTGKTVHRWKGYCPVHDRVRADDVRAAKDRYPGALLMAHPECRSEVLAGADAVCSTSGMLRFVKTAQGSEFIVGTETGMIYPLQKTYPDRRFYPLSERMVCADMKKITPPDVVRCLEQMSGEVKVPEAIRQPAFGAVQRMIEISG